MTVGAPGAVVMPAFDLVTMAVQALIRVGVVIKVLFPVVRIVAKGALAGIVRLFDDVTLLTIVKVGMVKDHLFPVVDVVAVGAWTGIVIFRSVVLQVARLAIGEASMIEGKVFPLVCVFVTVHTGVGRPMHRYCLRLSEGPKVRQPGYVPQRTPSSHIVLGWTVSQMAGLALGNPVVFIGRVFPVVGTVAGRALPGVVSYGRIAFQVTRFAIRIALVIKGGIVPVGCAGVATFTGVQTGFPGI